MSAVTTEDFAHNLVQEVIATAEANNETPHDAFASTSLQDLEAAGIFDEHFVAYYRSHGVEVSGYGRNEPLGSLDLFFVSFRQHPLLAKVGKAELATWGKRVLTYLARADSGLAKQIDESDDAHDMALAVKEYLPHATQIRVFIITNDVATTRSLPNDEFQGRPVSFEIWDLTRLHRLATSGILNEPITVSFDDPLPCLATTRTEENYSVLLAIVPGRTLAEMYAEYGGRLLELNVRSFLQLKGAVNKGIRETLLHRPERFLAYNNGISATASKVSLVDLPDGGTGIAMIQDLQVVNGGQTTATVHHVYTKDGKPLDNALVQMKLTVVQPDLLDVIVPEISKFSNTQNKVTITDFSSNHKYHVELEKLTRTLWAPAPSGGQETKWFYERARGQYADALSKERTPASKAKFKVIFPTKQKFTKTDVAKWEMSWGQKPQIVSRGGEKNFRAFMDSVGTSAPTTDIDFVRRLIARGILFRDTERIVTDQHFGGYRANIVAYAIAKLSNSTAMRIDFDQIWSKQAVSEALSASLTELSHLVYGVIIDPPPGTTNVGEWAKRDACWARVLSIPWTLPQALEDELLDVGKTRTIRHEDQQASATEENHAEAEVVKSLSAEAWFALAKWAKETGNLAPWQRSLAFSLGKVIARSGEPSVKQSRQGAIIVQEATDLGFRP